MLVDGHCAPGYESFRDVVARNAEPTGDDPGDVGCSFALVHHGELVVDLWAGLTAVDGPPWEHDTLVNMYSVGKPLAALVALDAVGRGELALDRPLAEVWHDLERHHPTTTLRHALAHRAGLPAVGGSLEADAIYSWDTMTAALADTTPWWEPGTTHGYHVNTFGFLAGHPVVGVTGRSFSELLHTRITGPAGADVAVGLGPREHHRVASVVLTSSGLDPGAAWPSTTRLERMRRNAYFNPPGLSGIGVVNSPEWRTAAVPSTNGQGTARGMAAIFARLLPEARHPLIDPGLIREATTEHSSGDDLVLGRPTRFGLGFQLHQDERPIGSSPESFGHFGFGGSMVFADPARDVACCYLINRPGDRWQNPRTLRLIDAVREI